MSDNANASKDEFGNSGLGGLARGLGGGSKRIWGRHGPEISHAGRRVGYAAAIVANALLFYVFHNLLRWQVPFVTEAWTSVLWAVDMSLAASIVANALYFAYDKRWLRRLGGVITGAFSFLSTYVIWKAFPFDFGAPWNEMASMVLLVLLFAIVIGIVVEAVQLLTDQGR